MPTGNIRGGNMPWGFNPQQNERLAALSSAHELLRSGDSSGSVNGYELVTVAAFILSAGAEVLPLPTAPGASDAEQRLAQLQTFGWDRIEKALGIDAARLVHG